LIKTVDGIMYLYYVIFVPWAGGLFCTIKNLNLNLSIFYSFGLKQPGNESAIFHIAV